MLYIKNINGKILKRVLPNNFYNTSKEYAKEYIPSVIYAIIDPCMNSGGCGVFFSKEGAHKYYEKNKKLLESEANRISEISNQDIFGSSVQDNYGW